MPKIIGIVLLAYIIIPFDLLPDAPFIGWLDDASLAALGLFIISKIVPESVLDEYRGVSGVRGPESGVKDENQDNH